MSQWAGPQGHLPESWTLLQKQRQIYFYLEKVKRLFGNCLPGGRVRRGGHLVLSCTFSSCWAKVHVSAGPDMDSVRFGEQPGVLLSPTQEDFLVGPWDFSRVNLWAGGGFPHLDKRQLWRQGVSRHQSTVGETPNGRKKRKSKPLTAFYKTNIWKPRICYAQRNRLHYLLQKHPLSAGPLPLHPIMGWMDPKLKPASDWGRWLREREAANVTPTPTSNSTNLQTAGLDQQGRETFYTGLD